MKVEYYYQTLIKSHIGPNNSAKHEQTEYLIRDIFKIPKVNRAIVSKSLSREPIESSSALTRIGHTNIFEAAEKTKLRFFHNYSSGITDNSNIITTSRSIIPSISVINSNLILKFWKIIHQKSKYVKDVSDNSIFKQAAIGNLSTQHLNRYY